MTRLKKRLLAGLLLCPILWFSGACGGPCADLYDKLKRSCPDFAQAEKMKFMDHCKKEIGEKREIPSPRSFAIPTVSPEKYAKSTLNGGVRITNARNSFPSSTVKNQGSSEPKKCGFSTRRRAIP